MLRANLIPLTDAQRDRAATVFRMARGMALRASATRPALAAELESEAGLTVVQAARSFRPRGDCPFSQYARVAVALRLRNLHRRERLRGYRNHLAATRPAPRFADPSVLALVPSREPAPGASLEAEDAFEARIRGLPPRARKVLRMAFVEGCSAREIGRRLGMSGETVRMTYVRAVVDLGGACTTFPSTCYASPSS